MTLAPRIATTLDGMKDMLYHDNLARVLKGDKNRLKAQAQRKGYRWSWVKEGRYYIVKVIK